jgi:hypothetical protein
MSRPEVVPGATHRGRPRVRFGHPRRARSAAAFPVVGALLIAVLMCLPAGAGQAQSLGRPAATGAASHPALESSPSAGPRSLTGGPPASGRGSFFSTTILPKAAISQAACFDGTCVNATSDPSVNLTTTGTLAVAYTSYSDVRACGSTFSEIAVVTSSDLGGSWSTPTYLNNPDCHVAANDDSNYSNSWEPSLTSLGNGTLVLVYVQYNTTDSAAPDLEWDDDTWTFATSYNVPYDRLVVTELYPPYTGSWTAPRILNASNNPSLDPSNFWSPLTPSAAAFGNTVYVAWTSMNTVVWNNAGKSSVAVISSTDGGTTWGSVSLLPTMRYLPMGLDAIPAAINPAVEVLPSGELVVAYVGNITTWGTLYGDPFCEPTYCNSAGADPGGWPMDGADIVVARSTANGSSFNYSTVPFNPSNEPFWIVNAAAGADYGFSIAGGAGGYGGQGTYDGMYPLLDPAPSMTYDPATGQLFLAFEAGNLTEVSDWFPTTTVFVTNSSDGGAAWSTPRQVDPSLIQATSDICAYQLSYTTNGCFSQAEGDASIAIANGSLVVSFGYYNYSACGFDSANNVECGMVEQLVYSSSDNGVTFQSDGPASDALTVDDALYPGAHTSALGAGLHLWLLWTQPWCPDWVTAVCEWPQAGPDGPQVVVSEPFTGTGVKVSFSETGIPAGTPWSVDIAGNVRSAVTPASLSVSGVPVNNEIGWTVGSSGAVYATTYGTRYTVASTSPGSPASFTADSTVFIGFQTQYLLQTNSSPYYPACGLFFDFGSPICWDDIVESELNYNLTSTSSALPAGSSVGATWLDTGTEVTLAVTPQPQWMLGSGNDLDELNLTFESWSGVGPGSVSSSNPSVTVSVNAPVNETANFFLDGGCVLYVGPPTTGSCDYLNYTVVFSESGLPTGTPWGVTTSSSVTNTFSSNETTLSTLSITNQSNLGVSSYRAWSVPAAGGELWIPESSDPASPIEQPGQNHVTVNYSLANPLTTEFSVQVRDTGLPTTVSNYSVTLGAATLGISGTTGNFTVLGGATAVGAPPVFVSNGTGFYLASVTVIPDVVNESWENVTTSPTGIVTIEGPAILILNFAPEYYLNVEAGYGGTANVSSQWVRSGGSVDMMANPDPGYSFVGWSGPVNASSPSISVRVTAPSSEVATFRPLPPETYTAIVTEVGLPVGVSTTVVIGGRAFSSANASFGVSGLNGTYSLEVPTVYANESNLSRFVPEVVNPTFPGAAGQIEVHGLGWINITYQPQFVVDLASVGNGTISPAPGARWVNTSTTLPLVATPLAGNRLSQWVGTGPGSENSTATSIEITVTAPLTETATFVVQPATSARGFALTVAESGLPSGVSWSFSVGTLGGFGGGSALLVGGLAGSYDLVVPDVYVGVGTRYVANFTTEPVDVVANSSISVTFSVEFLLGVTNSTGGTAGASVAGWIASGTSVTFTATPQAGWQFSGWTGTGSGSVNSGVANLTVAVTGPVSEAALFAPAPPPAAGVTSALSPNALPLDLGLLIGLLALGFILAFLVGRRRRGDEGGPEEDGAAGTPGDESEGPATEDPPWVEDGPGSPEDAPSSADFTEES